MGGLTIANIRRGVAQAGSARLLDGRAVCAAGLHDRCRACGWRPSLSTRSAFTGLEAACIPTNTASMRLLEKCGFAREGLARQYLCINGQWQDHVLYARLWDDPVPPFPDAVAHNFAARRGWRKWALRAVLSALGLPRLICYTIARTRYAGVDGFHSKTSDETVRPRRTMLRCARRWRRLSRCFAAACTTGGFHVVEDGRDDIVVVRVCAVQRSHQFAVRPQRAAGGAARARPRRRPKSLTARASTSARGHRRFLINSTQASGEDGNALGLRYQGSFVRGSARMPGDRQHGEYPDWG